MLGSYFLPVAAFDVRELPRCKSRPPGNFNCSRDPALHHSPHAEHGFPAIVQGIQQRLCHLETKESSCSAHTARSAAIRTSTCVTTTTTSTSTSKLDTIPVAPPQRPHPSMERQRHRRALRHNLHPRQLCPHRRDPRLVHVPHAITHRPRNRR